MRLAAPVTLALVIALFAGHPAGGASSDEAAWFKKLSGFTVPGDLAWEKAKAFCICRENAATPVTGYFIKRVSSLGGVRRPMLFCVIPEFHTSTGEFLTTSTCLDFLTLTK